MSKNVYFAVSSRLVDERDALAARVREARQLIAWAIPIVAEHSAFVGNERLDEVMMRWLEQGVEDVA